MSDIYELRNCLAAKQNELDKASHEMEDVKRIIEKQGEICRKVDTFKQLVNSLANSMNKGEYYDITRFSDMESCIQILNESGQYVPDSAMTEFKDSCVFLDGIIKIKLKSCSDIERLKFMQLQGKMSTFFSNAHESHYKEKLSDLTLDALMNKMRALNADIASLTEKLRAAENDPAQKDASELNKIADEAFDIKDYTTAFKYYRIAAEKGDAHAQFRLGKLYDEGWGVRLDYLNAIRYYRLAADQGEARAQCNLGCMYEDGRGVRQDYQEAARYYRLAADQGNASAQCNLGVMYAEGWGVRQDEQEAVRYYRLAANQGFQLAIDNLKSRGESW